MTAFKKQPPADRMTVEWHDSLWCPAINTTPRFARRQGAGKMLVPRLVLPQTMRLKKFPMKKNPQRRRAAFTLVELLTVIAIIGILAAMLLPALIKVREAAKKRQASIEEAGIVTAITSYDADYGRYPITPQEQQAANGNDFTAGLLQYPQGPNNTLSWPAGANGNYSYDNNNNIIAILMDALTYQNGQPTCNTNHIKNPKQVKYLNAKMSGYDPTTAQLNPPGGVDNTGVYRDPWGNPYIITMNTSYSLDGSGAAQGQGASDLFYSQQVVSQVNSGASAGYNGLSNPNTNPNTDNFLYHGKVMVWSAGSDGKFASKDSSNNPIKANAGVNKDNVISWQ